MIRIKGTVVVWFNIQNIEHRTSSAEFYKKLCGESTKSAGILGFVWLEGLG